MYQYVLSVLAISMSSCKQRKQGADIDRHKEQKKIPLHRVESRSVYIDPGVGGWGVGGLGWQLGREGKGITHTISSDNSNEINVHVNLSC